MSGGLRRLLERWVAEGLIEPGQRDAILARGAERARSIWGVACAVIGGVLCVSGISLLIAANWTGIPDGLKLGALLLLLAVSTIAGVEGRARTWNRAVSELGFLGAGVFPLLGLALLSQMFHLDGPVSQLAGLWWAAIAVLPFVSRSAVSWVLWIAAGYWWLGARLSEIPGIEWWQGCAVFSGVGILLATASQSWRREPGLRAIGEFAGISTTALAVFLWGFDSSSWIALWGLLFLAALTWGGFSASTGRIHQLNLSFVTIGVVILGTFLRLAGTMIETGWLFVQGGVGLLVLTGVLGRLRGHVMRRMA